MYSFFVMVVTVEAAVEQPQRRKVIRLPRKIKAVVESSQFKANAFTVDISEAGAALMTTKKYLHPTEELNVKLFSPYEVTTLKAKVKHVKNYDQKTVLAVEFINVSEEQKKALIRHMFCPTESWLLSHKQEKIKQASLLSELFRLLKAAGSVFLRTKVSHRLAPRYNKNKGAFIQVVVQDITIPGRLNDITYGGLSFYSRRTKRFADKLVIVFPETNLQLTAKLKWKKGFLFSQLNGVEFATPLSAGQIKRILTKSPYLRQGGSAATSLKQLAPERQNQK